MKYSALCENFIMNILNLILLQILMIFLSNVRIGKTYAKIKKKATNLSISISTQKAGYNFLSFENVSGKFSKSNLFISNIQFKKFNKRIYYSNDNFYGNIEQNFFLYNLNKN